MLLILFIISLASSFAYFTANISGVEETSTITVEAGTMNITYNSGPNLNIKDIYPREEVWLTKNFTITGNNTTNLEMLYTIHLIVNHNTFSIDSLKYKILSTDSGVNGSTIPVNGNKTGIKTGSSSIKVGTGIFEGPTQGNKTHSYILEIYFLETGFNQNKDQGKEFSAYIDTTENCQNCLNEKTLATYGGENVISELSKENLSNASVPTDNFIHKIDDDYGTSYYYRGAKNLLNNNLIFGEMQWKIIRINGNGSIRIIYNGVCPNNNCVFNQTGASTHVGLSRFNATTGDNKYFGYMYGGLAGEASTSRELATKNETSSTMKTFLDTWYENNFVSKNLENNISDTLFCNDRRLRSEVGGADTGTGIGDSMTTYASDYLANLVDILKCGQKNDRFTVSDTAIGNGDLKYPIGLINNYEAYLAGLSPSTGNSSNYLYINLPYWTLTPVGWHNSSMLVMNIISTSGSLAINYLNNQYNVRPVINLKPETKVVGDGSLTNPYKVI